MKILAALSLALSAAFVIFLACSFANATLDISLWSEGWRAFCAFIMLICATIVGIGSLIPKHT